MSRKTQYLTITTLVVLYLLAAASFYLDGFSSIEREAIETLPQVTNRNPDKNSINVEYCSANFCYITFTEYGLRFDYGYLKHAGKILYSLENYQNSYRHFGLDNQCNEKKGSEQYYSELESWVRRGGTIIYNGDVSLKQNAFFRSNVIFFIFIICWILTLTNSPKKTEIVQNKYCDYEKDYSSKVWKVIRVVSYILMIITFYVLWVNWTMYYKYDMPVVFMPQIFIYYILVYYLIRDHINEIDPNYMGTDGNNPSIHDSYIIQKKGHKSLNPILFVLDYLFQYCPAVKDSLFFPLTFCLFPLYFSLYILTFVGLWNDSLSLPSHLMMLFIIFVNGCRFLYLDKLYRRYRHKYYKKHDKPGVYGWGTIDYQRADTYRNDLSIASYIDYMQGLYK